MALQGKVAVVAGASRGAGAGVAKSLGSAGATVYVTGRTTRGGPQPADRAAGTVQDTAEEVTRRGGRGIAVACDHRDDSQVAALFQRVAAEQGRLDLLVNAVWGGNEVPTLQSDWGQPSWDLPAPEYWDRMFESSLRAAIMASQHAARIMAAQGSGILIQVSFKSPGDAYIGNLFYDVAKAGLNRLAFCLAHELRAHGVAALALSPGHMRTERVLAAFNTDEAHWREVPGLAGSETPEYLGRAVVALASDSAVLLRSGQTLAVGDLAQEYGFTDVDGSKPPPFKPPTT